MSGVPGQNRTRPGGRQRGLLRFQALDRNIGLRELNFAFLFILGEKQLPALTKINPQQWLMLLAITFSTGMVALVIYYYGLKKTPARVSTIAELVWPASAIFIDYFLYKSILSPTQILGVILLFIAIYHVSKFSK